MSVTSQLRKRSRDDDDSPDIRGSARRALFSELETDAPGVCAIDFGTARTGYAYVFTRNPDEIKVKQPGGQEPGKARTSLLLDDHGNFLAFGSKAREDYYEWDEKGMLFENYKMQLEKKHDGSTPLAYDLRAGTQPLLRVITLSLEYVKDQAMEDINRSQPKVMSAHEIKWVVTVPAIWRDSAKGMMRKAAFDAGMISSEDSEKLVLCLEPEAACMACEDQRLSEQGAGGSEILKVGDRFMVLDCGGGTVDITMHQVEATKPLRLSEICAPDGGPFGSTFVDHAFEKFVQELMGLECWNRFKPSAAWVDLMKAWEETKLAFDPSEMQDDEATPVRINLAALVGDGVLGSKTLQDCVDGYNSVNGGSLRLRRGTTVLMSLNQTKMLFKKVINKIIQKVKELIDENPVQYIYLVGGFAECKMLQIRVKQEFETEESGRRVIVPMRPQLMVVKGAVLFGLQKVTAFTSRVARYTYGCSIRIHYNERNSEHVRRGYKTQVKQGTERKYVKGSGFSLLVKQGTKISAGETHSSTEFWTCSDDQTSISFTLYATVKPFVEWIDDPSLILLGDVEVPCSQVQSTTLSISFGSSEISAAATNRTTSEVTRAQIKWNFNAL